MMEKQTCWICEEFDQCPYPVCYAQEKESKQLAEDWERDQEVSDEHKQQELF